MPALNCWVSRALFFTLVLSLLLSPLSLHAQETQEIVPGKSMGPLTLGMLCKDVPDRETLRFSVEVECDGQGVLRGVSTNTGGSISLGYLMVGTVSAPRVIKEFGEHFTATHDATYEQSVAYWLVYSDIGVGFRIVYLDKLDTDLLSGRSGLQRIRVFVPNVSNNSRGQ